MAILTTEVAIGIIEKGAIQMALFEIQNQLLASADVLIRRTKFDDETHGQVKGLLEAHRMISDEIDRLNGKK